MKKLLSVILAVVIACTCLTVAFAAEKQNDLGFAVASDLHIILPEEELEKTNDDPIFWYANRKASMDDECGYILDSFLKQCANDDSVEFILIPGDITNDGYFFPEQHEFAIEKLRKFEKETGKQIYVINGNHDVRNGNFKFYDFKNYYAEFGYDEAIEVRENDCSYTAKLGEKYLLIALDSCAADKSTADGMTKDKIEWVRKQTEYAKEHKLYPILMMHHNLLDHMPLQTIISKNFIIKNSKITANKFADWGIKLVLTGHEHCSDATSLTSARGNVIYDFATTALTMYPVSYRVFGLTDNEIKYADKKVENIDTVALSKAVSGYTPEMLNAMNADFDAYSKGFLKAGVQYRLALSLSPEKLKIDEKAFYYDFVMSVVNTLTGSLEAPLFGKNSLSEKGKKYGIELPASNYKNGWDLATDLVASHYAGNENLTLDSAEVTTLLRAVAIILREEFATIGDGLYLTAATEMIKNMNIPFVSGSLEALTKTVFGEVTPLGYFTVALLSPLLYEFAFDADDVDDNNGVLPGYGSAQANDNAANIKNNVSNIFGKIFKYINLMLQYILKIIPEPTK